MTIFGYSLIPPRSKCHLLLLLNQWFECTYILVSASCVEKSATSSSSTVSEASAAPSCDSGVGVGGGSLSSSVEIKQEMLDSLSSTTTSNPNPTNPKGGRRPLFDSMRFYSIGASEEAIHMLTEHGAVQENALSRQVTHIIAG